MADAALTESKIRSQVDSLSFVHDNVYSRQKAKRELYADNTVDIPASFFDEFD